MINIAVVILGIVGVCSQIATRKSPEHEKPLVWVGLQYGAMIGIIVLGGYSQYTSKQSDAIYRKATLEIEVLSKVSEHFIPVLKNTAELQKNMLTVKSYLSYQQAKERNPDLAAHFDWYKDSTDSQKIELEEAKKAFAKLQSSAANIVQLNVAHGSVIPVGTFEWADATLEMKFSELADYFDPYAPVGESPKRSVIDHVDRTGKAFGLVMGRLRSATDLLSED